jgi:hypothetical protein
MTRQLICFSAAALLAAHFVGCSDSGTSGTAGTGGGSSGSGGSTSTGGSSGSVSGSGGTASSTGGTASSTGGTVSSTGGVGGAAGSGPTFDEATAWINAYKAANPGNGGKDWDINAKTPAQIAADPAAQQLLSLCGQDQRPVIPLLAWEYGGTDHQWINPQASALVYCVYIPVSPSTTHWAYDVAADHVTADLYVRYPEQNPCKDQQGANQVMSCLGDASNIEILVDTASLNDGSDAGLSLANASTDLYLILADQTKVHMYTGL